MAPGLRWLLIAIVPPAALAVAACTSGAGSASAASAPPLAPTPPAAEVTVAATGELQPIEGMASGTAELVSLPDGTYEVILEDFSIASAAHTNVVLVRNDEVARTGDIDKSMLLDLGPLTGTSGMQTYVIPADMVGQVMEAYHSVVIWDTEMAHAIAAAALT